MKVAICTVLSMYRLHQGIALYKSLMHYSKEFRYFFLCVDESSYQILKAFNLKNLTVLKLDEVEDEQLKAVKGDRSLSEYCWTLKPALLLHVRNKHPQIEMLCYSDTDLFFYNNPNHVFNLGKRHSVLVTTHKIDNKCNGGFVCFRNDLIGIESLKWWRQECIKWCYAIWLDNLYGDQGHLNELRHKFRGVYYINSPGVNVSWYNYYKYRFYIKRNSYHVNFEKLIYYHFSGLRMGNLDHYLNSIKDPIICSLYSEYHSLLKDIAEEIDNYYPEYSKCLLFNY